MKLSSVIGATFFAVSLLGCAATSEQEIINSLVIQNKSSSVLSDVRLKVPETGGVVSCSTIPLGGECSLGFRARENQNNMVDITWRQNGKIYNKKVFENRMKRNSKGIPLTVYLGILDQGSIDVSME